MKAGFYPRLALDEQTALSALCAYMHRRNYDVLYRHVSSVH